MNDSQAGGHEARPAAGPGGIAVHGAMGPGFEEILDAGALQFLHGLAEAFAPRIEELLAARAGRRAAWRNGLTLDFEPRTADVRNADWKVAELPADLQQRVVEITGPVDRKMVINALNSGADTFMADFEDASSPSWSNMVSGQANLRDAVRRRIEFTDAARGKQYSLNENPATLLVRPRGLHLVERHVTVADQPLPASLFDFGLFAYHNAAEQLRRGTGPYFYLPKLEHYLEARLWNDVFVHAQRALDIPQGSIKATVLIETLPAAFQMNEILHELREHSAGLNCGRWDYIFSFIKCRRSEPGAVLPDRSQVTMEQPFMRAYTQLAVRTCHRRGVHAIGGMAAQIPIKNDEQANRAALDKVQKDKLREVGDGHDGTWVAHPGLVALARDAFRTRMEGANQIERLREDVRVEAAHLLEVPTGSRTEHGLRWNIRVGVQYLESWLRGLGCVPLYDLMEDAATAEISRAQVWQWLHHAADLEDGRTVDRALVERLIAEEMSSIEAEVGAERLGSGRYDDARKLFADLCFSEELEEFLTSYAYRTLEIQEAGS
ncbi:MAG: malate synthase A [bacterium]|nr:malate synthase A [bacterium]